MNRQLLAALAVLSLAASGAAVAVGVRAASAEARSPLPIVPVGTSPDYAVVEVGSGAPDFSYESLAGGWSHLRELREQGHVLLVFGAGDARLAQLEIERVKLATLGVVPVAVLDLKAGTCRATVRRLGLGYPVVSDPQRVIGAQFNALDERSRRNAPAWFVVDRTGRVRALKRYEWPRGSWVELASLALGLPSADTPAPASFHER